MRYNVQRDQDGEQMLLCSVNYNDAKKYCDRYNRHAQGDNPNGYVSGHTYSVQPHEQSKVDIEPPY